jgi:hypothetical protein
MLDGPHPSHLETKVLRVWWDETHKWVYEVRFGEDPSSAAPAAVAAVTSTTTAAAAASTSSSPLSALSLSPSFSAGTTCWVAADALCKVISVVDARDRLSDAYKRSVTGTIGNASQTASNGTYYVDTLFELPCGGEGTGGGSGDASGGGAGTREGGAGKALHSSCHNIYHT